MILNRMIRNERGFTLVELLVVIAIIGILATMVLLQLGSARVKARDVQRITRISQIQTALEMYYDVYGKYPTSGQCGATKPNVFWSNSIECLSNGHWLRDNTTDLSSYLPTDPIDPINQFDPATWARGAFYYWSGQYGETTPKSWYMLVYALEKYPNARLENSDGLKAPDGTVFHYGNGSDGIITVGGGKLFGN